MGIIGLGFRLGYLGYVFKTIDPSFDIVGYVDPDPAGLPGLTEGYIGRQGLRNARSADCRETLDLLMIGSPNHFHLDHIRIGLEAGLKVFCEKPVVTTIEDSIALAHLMARFGQERLMVGLVLRYSPLYKDLVAEKAKGTLGHVVSIEASEHIYPYHAPSSCATGVATRSSPAASCWRSAATISISTTASSGRGRSGSLELRRTADLHSGQ